MYGISLFGLSQTNKFRKFCFTVIRHSKFDFFIILVIFLSAIQLALETPIANPNDRQASVLYWIDVSTTIIFWLEAIFKIVAFGFAFNGKWSYLR